MFDYLGKFSAVFRISGYDLELSGFLLSKWFGGDGGILCKDLDLFENFSFELFVLLIADEFQLSAEESDLTLVPLERAVDVLIEFDP